MSARLDFHELANVLPLIEGTKFDRLVADIAQNGLVNPITLHEGKILDGRNRERACHAARIAPRYVEFDGRDPASFVLSQNLARRHMGPSERAMVAARMANLKWGQRADRVEGSIDLSTAAKLVSVSEPSVKRARAVLEYGTPELCAAVEHGRIAVHEAAQAAKLPPEMQADFLEAAGAGKSCMVWSVGHRRKQLVDVLAETTRALPIGKQRWPTFMPIRPGDTNIPPSLHPIERSRTITQQWHWKKFALCQWHHSQATMRCFLCGPQRQSLRNA
jgi:hypothetical protein